MHCLASLKGIGFRRCVVGSLQVVLIFEDCGRAPGHIVSEAGT